MKKIQKNVSLSKYTTLGLGGSAKYFAVVKTKKELVDAMNFAKKKSLNTLILGGGSNLLIGEKGFDGVVIKNEIKGIQKRKNTIVVESGEALSELIAYLNDNGLAGMEKMAGIPGSVGGAIRGNAGAYGQTISDCLVRVKILEEGRIKWISHLQGGFEYRDSIFKKENLIILGAEFILRESDKKELEKNSKEIIKLRAIKYEPSIKCPGSFFKNVLTKDLSKKVLSKIPKDYIMYGKIPAGQLLEAVGANGKRLGGIKIADHHGNLFVNTGNGTASEFCELSEKYSSKVKEKFGIELEPEVQLIDCDNKIAILGLGLEGRDLYEYFSKKGYEIAILDENEKVDLKGIDKKNTKIIKGKNYLKSELNSFDVIYRSPGVYRYLPEIIEAEKKGMKISSAVELFFEKCEAKIIGVTGTKGKGTTSTLIYEILKKAKKDVYLAGNIGKPFLSLLPKLTSESIVILEISSFQLVDMEVSPNIAVVLNITLDHMDWHKDKKEYLLAKENIVKYQKKQDFAVINNEYASSKKFLKLTKAKVIPFEKSEVTKKQKNSLLLRGEHNLENVSAALKVAKILKVKDEVILKVLSSFKGLEHRLELVGKVNGVSYYNDSFATSPQPTVAAIKSFTEDTTLILGGSEKKLDYLKFGVEVARQENVKIVILIGDMAKKIKDSLENAGFEGKIIEMGKPKMTEIVDKAKKITSSGGVVLLSPAAASFDMFESYKDRGNQFRSAVERHK